MDKFAYLSEELKGLEFSGLGRNIPGDMAGMVDFCSNDYLNIAADGRVVEAVCGAVRELGYGARGSRLICGTTEKHRLLEERFAKFLHKEAALLFPSGWMANEAVIRTIPQKGDIVLMDKADHASIIDAARASDAEFRTFRRDNPDRLQKFLADEKYRRKFIVTESIFSMDGDVADIAALVELKNEYDAILIVDEAHSVGCMGRTGAGLCAELGLLDEVDIVVAPMGKAIGGCGGIVAGTNTVVKYLVNKARAFIYTTAPPAANCAAGLAAMDIISNEPKRRETLAGNAAYLRNMLKEKGLDTGNSCSHIIPVIIGESAKTVAVAKELQQKGYKLVAIRPPTVAAGTARLRISVQSRHTKEQLDGLVEAIVDVMKGQGLG